MDWKDALSKAEYDDVEVALGDTKVKFGDLRKMFADTSSRAGSLEGTLQEREDQIAALMNQIETIRNAPPPAAEQKTEAAKPPIDYEHDALFGPLYREMKKTQEETVKIQKGLQGLFQAVSKNVGGLRQQVWNAEWARIPDNKIELEAAVKFAQRHGLMGPDGNPNPFLARQVMTFEEDKSSAIKKAADEAYERGRAEAGAAAGASLLSGLSLGAVTANPNGPKVNINPNADLATNLRANLEAAFTGKAA
jgi:septal ring factor EnvC (AmiA/AmiB activator)